MKPLFVISCPIDTFSGYGARSRDIALSIINSNKYDLRILPQRWGNTPYGFLDSSNPEHAKILACMMPNNNLEKQPDIWAQITVPNEFQAVGKFNIGITAGIETTVCDVAWLEGMNRMSLNLVSSEHAKKVFLDSKYEKRNSQNNQLESIVELTAPIEVLFEGVNTNIYKKIDEFQNKDLHDFINDIPESYAFLFVGHWLQGDMNEDRKNITGLIRIFLETFKNKTTQPALILKTQSATPSIMDREEMLDKIRAIQTSIPGKLPPIYLLHGEFTDEDMNELYNNPKIKTLVSFTKGEGYGRPLLEFTTSQKPVLTTGWSGHVDFLNPDMSILLPGQLTQVHPSAQVANMILAESAWFTVDDNVAADALNELYKNYKKWIDGAKRQAYRSRTEFSLEKMAEKIISILDTKVPKQAEFKLPQLKKIELPKLKLNDK
jgi:glycosyltransferase involved in cell wall biosynthesis